MVVMVVMEVTELKVVMKEVVKKRPVTVVIAVIAVMEGIEGIVNLNLEIPVMIVNGIAVMKQ